MQLPSEDVKISMIIKKLSRPLHCRVLFALLIVSRESTQLGLAVVCISPPEDFQLNVFNILITKHIKSKTNLHSFGHFFIKKNEDLSFKLIPGISSHFTTTPE